MILFFKDKIIKWNLVASLLLNILLWILLYFRIPIQIEPLALRYNIYVGINLIGNWYSVFYFSLIGLLIIILNFGLSKLLYKKNKLLTHWLATTALICQLILLAWAVIMVMVNG
ncbi:hypothetical protein L6278_01500 [Candidatus Parcubacteria bacterium]|nr:hypothetical protein [Patescibacteria group bacterium]MBU4482178.1 hypothetical protein [Patescibacteria group bacterium]MCG2686796.1 hypothetical protein [Candidatus Parcubacteria bacterium]